MPLDEEPLRLDQGNILRRFESRTEDFFFRLTVLLFWRLMLERRVFELPALVAGIVGLDTSEE